MTYERAVKRRKEIEERLGEIEGERDDLRDEERDLERELGRLDKEFPPAPVPRRVGAFAVDGETWHSDGFRAVLGPWPDEHWADPEMFRDAGKKAADLIGLQQAESGAVVDVEHVGLDFVEGVALARLSNGKVVNHQWLLDALKPEGATVHAGQPGLTPVPVKLGEKLIAIIMPVNLTPGSEIQRAAD